jgi:hypothetical protein
MTTSTNSAGAILNTRKRRKVPVFRNRSALPATRNPLNAKKSGSIESMKLRSGGSSNAWDPAIP